MSAATAVSTASGSAPATSSPSACPIGADSLSFLSAYARSQRFATGQPSGFAVASQGERVYFLRTEGEGAVTQNLYEVDLSSGTERLLVRAHDLVAAGDEAAMSDEERKLRERKRLVSKGILSFQSVPANPDRILIPYQQHLYLFDRRPDAPRRVTNLTESSPFEALGPASYAQLSPDGKVVAFVRAGDIFIIELDGEGEGGSGGAAVGEEYRLTSSGSSVDSAHSNGVSEFIAQEELGRFKGFWFSPDSRALLFQHTDTAAMERMHILDLQNPAADPDASPYPRPGKHNATVTLGLLPIARPLQTFAAVAAADGAAADQDQSAAKKRKIEGAAGASASDSSAVPATPLASAAASTVWLQWDREQFPYLCTVAWSAGAPLSLVVQNRLQSVSALLVVDDLRTGVCRQLLEERDARWVNLDHSTPQWINGGRHLLWASEQPTGLFTLYLCDSEGRRLRPLAGADTVRYRKLLQVDETRGVAFVLGGEATEQHIYRLPIGPLSADGATADSSTSVIQLTSTRAVHSGVFATGANVYVQEIRSLEHAPRFVVRRLPDSDAGAAAGSGMTDAAAAGVADADSATAGPLLYEIANLSATVPSQHLPHVQILQIQASEQLAIDELAKSDAMILRDAQTNPLTIALRELVPKRTSLLDVTGTADAAPAAPLTLTYNVAVLRPSNFNSSRRYPVVCYCYGGPGHRLVTRDRGTFLVAQWIANRGYIVVVTDGRGTPWRGADWEKAISGDYQERPLRDQVAVIKALAVTDYSMDLSRGVAMYGWSFGGYLSALCVMRYPSFFTAAFSGAPVCDWLDYDTCYTERVLGLPLERAAAYERSSVLTYAPQLLRPLLLVHGYSDDNVYFAHALKMSAELFKHGRDHVFLPLGGTHMLADPMVTVNMYTRLALFLMQHIPPTIAP